MVPTDVIDEENHKLDLGCDFLKLGTFPVIWHFYQHVTYACLKTKNITAIGEEICKVGI